MNSPIKTPINNDKIVCFVINANIIATKGGINVSIPNLTEFSALCGNSNINNENMNRSIIVTNDISPIFVLEFKITTYIIFFIKKNNY